VSTDDSSQFRPLELAQMLAILGRKRPAVIVITGDAGMGKTRLLEDLRARAATQGWAIAGSDSDRRLTIEPRTTRDQFREDLLATLPEPRDVTAPTASEQRSPLAAAAGVAWRALTQKADPVLAELARRSEGDPVLVTIDDYRPSAQFGSWFQRRFLPGLVASDLPMVAAMAERRGNVNCRASATDVIALAPLSPEFIRRALADVSPDIDPPLSAHEVRVYAREATSPVLLDSLVRVLALAHTPEPPE